MWEETDPHLVPPSYQGVIESMRVFTGKYSTGINCGLIKQAVSQKRLPQVWSWTSSRCITTNTGKEIILKKNPINKAATRKCLFCSVWHLGKCSCQENRSAGTSGTTDVGPKGFSKLWSHFPFWFVSSQGWAPPTQPPLCTHRPDSQIKKLVWWKLERHNTSLLWLTPKLIVGLLLTQVHHLILPQKQVSSSKEQKGRGRKTWSCVSI